MARRLPFIKLYSHYIVDINSSMKKVTQDIRKIGFTGGTTYYLTIPKEMIRELKWRKGERKVIRLEDDRLVIEDWKR